jgi:hypothetical protein
LTLLGAIIIWMITQADFAAEAAKLNGYGEFAGAHIWGRNNSAFAGWRFIPTLPNFP